MRNSIRIAAPGTWRRRHPEPDQEHRRGTGTFRGACPGAWRARCRGCVSRALGELTPEPARRAGRALDAAQAKTEAGAFDEARDLLALAEDGPLTDFQRAGVELMLAQLAYVTNKGKDATPLLLQAARRLGPADAALSPLDLSGCLVRSDICRTASPPGGRSH